MANGNANTVAVPKWAIGLATGVMAMATSAAVAWAVNIDGTQRELLQDVSGLKEHRIHVTEQLTRIEDKLDQIPGLIENKLDRLLTK